jgi:hypothetical protein
MIPRLVRRSGLIAGIFLIANSQPEREIYVRSIEGPSIRVNHYQLRGSFPDGDRVRVMLTENNGTWTMRIRRAGRTRQVEFPVAQFPALHLNRVGVALLRGNRSASTLLIVVPYGSDHETCFINGEDVFSELRLYESPAGLRAERQRFRNCESFVDTPRAQSRRSRVIISGEPDG